MRLSYSSSYLRRVGFWHTHFSGRGLKNTSRYDFFFHITSDTCCFSSMVTHSCLGRERTTTVYSRWWTRWMISFELLCIYRRSPNGPWIMCDKLGGNCVESIFYSCICIVLCLGQPFYNSMTFHQMAHLVSDGLPRRSKWPVRGGSDWLPTRKQDIEPSSLLDTKQSCLLTCTVCFLSRSTLR